MSIIDGLLDVLRSFCRPLILVSALCLLSNPSAAWRKLFLLKQTFVYLILCKDKKFKIPAVDPASFFPSELGGTAKKDIDSTKYEYKTLILIRHGESTWNDTFNPGGRSKFAFVLFWIPNLIYALFMETYFFVSGKSSDSWFYDSALSYKGVKQAEGLRKFLQKEVKRVGTSGSNITNREDTAVKLLLALGETTSPKSMVVSSNLRRAISTAAIGLADRFVATATEGGDNIVLMPSLQEISINPDALTILPPGGTVHPTWCDNDIAGLRSGQFSQMVDTRYHTGNKALKSNGLIRLNRFCADVFSARLPKNTIIATGHSLFFRSFFQVYLPRNMEHVSKKKKLVNGGTVMVTLREAMLQDGTREYMIDPNSIVMVYGGFGKHTKG